MRRPLFLTGMMGCGKTTVGRVLAHGHGVPFIDLDDRIERLYGVTVPELLAAGGEPGFREAEARALESLLTEPGFGQRGVVVATGGGAVLRETSRHAIDQVGTRVYLEVSEDELVRRLGAAIEADPAERPLLQGGALGQRVAELLAARRSRYRAGAVSVAADDEPAAVAARVTAAIAGDEAGSAGVAREAPGDTSAGPPGTPSPAVGTPAVGSEAV